MQLLEPTDFELMSSGVLKRSIDEASLSLDGIDLKEYQQKFIFRKLCSSRFTFTIRHFDRICNQPRDSDGDGVFSVSAGIMLCVRTLVASSIPNMLYFATMTSAFYDSNA